MAHILQEKTWKTFIMLVMEGLFYQDVSMKHFGGLELKVLSFLISFDSLRELRNFFKHFCCSNGIEFVVRDTLISL